MNQGSLFSAKIEFFISLDILQKVILHVPCRGTQTSNGIGIGIPRGVFPLGRLGFESSPLYSGRAFRQRYFLPAGNMGKEGILCGSWERMSFFLFKNAKDQ